MTEKTNLPKSEDEWRDALNPAQYEICRCGGTERAFTGEYWDTKTTGVYECTCCGADLFDSETKYDSGSGWPSYWAPITAAAMKEVIDGSLGMSRTEVQCANCDSHLGHVFPDGPQPTGLRYCINSASLKLREK